MGKEIVYCVGCGGILREEDFQKGRAHERDHHPWCVRCRPLDRIPPPSRPLPAAPPKTTRLAPSTRRTRPSSARKGRRSAWLAGGGAVGIVVLLIVIAAGASHGSPMAAAPSPARPASAQETYSGVADLASHPNDPEAVLRRCAEVRLSLRGTPYEPMVQQLEEVARETKRSREREARRAETQPRPGPSVPR